LLIEKQGQDNSLEDSSAEIGAIDFGELFDVLPSPHMVLDANHCYVAVNRAYEQVVMRSREDLMGRNLFDLFPNDGESGRRLRESFDTVLETGEPDTLAYIPYDLPRPAELGGGMEVRYWSAVHTPIRGRDGKAYVMQNTVDVTDIVGLRQAASLPYRAGETQLLERAREAEEQHRVLLNESAEFRRLFQLAPGFFAVLSGPNHVFTFANDAYLRLVGDRELLGKPVSDALPEVVEQGFVKLLDGVYSTGRQYQAEATRLMLQKPGDDEPRETFLDFSYDAIRDADGTIIGVFVQGSDRTEDVKRQRRQRLLLAELNHRVKNTLASVQSIVSQTLRSAPDAETARHDIESRLAALSKAHNLLSAQEWTNTDLGAIIDQEVALFGPERVSLDGPPFTLSPKASISLAMLIHELSTNAMKYGALRGEEGRVRIVWKEGADGRLTLTWHETGGPPAAEPTRKGFGTRLIENIVKREFSGAFEPAYRAEGFSCNIRLEAAALRGARA